MGRHISLGYQIATCGGLSEVENRRTREQYTKHAKEFGSFCKREFGCRDFEDCRPFIQEYSKVLIDKQVSASTIHTYLAAICRAWQVPMHEIEKPRRISARNTRSRGVKRSDARVDARASASQPLVDFQKVVGIRRSELRNLRGGSFKQDESGYWCVEVLKGKGGKYQLQRIPESQVAFIRAYFDGRHAYVFSKDELNNKIDLHALRAQAARERYHEYEHRLRTDPIYRHKLESEIRARWRLYNKRRFDPKDVIGEYRLRGPNRELALKKGLPVVYDRMALMAVSIFHLSHWRLDVTVSNYMLAS